MALRSALPLAPRAARRGNGKRPAPCKRSVRASSQSRKRVGIYAGACARDDDSVNDFAEALIRQRQRRALLQHRDALARRLSISSGAILLPPREMMSLARPTSSTVPSGRHPREVAGLEVAARRTTASVNCGIVQIAEHAERSADLQLAGFAGRDGAAIPRDPELDAIGRMSDRAEAMRLIGGPETEIAGASFGQAIEIVDRAQARAASWHGRAPAQAPRRRSESCGVRRLDGGIQLNKVRNIDGTPAKTVASARPRADASRVNFGTSTSRAPS